MPTASWQLDWITLSALSVHCTNRCSTLWRRVVRPNGGSSDPSLFFLFRFAICFKVDMCACVWCASKRQVACTIFATTSHSSSGHSQVIGRLETCHVIASRSDFFYHNQKMLSLPYMNEPLICLFALISWFLHFFALFFILSLFSNSAYLQVHYLNWLYAFFLLFAFAMFNCFSFWCYLLILLKPLYHTGFAFLPFASAHFSLGCHPSVYV